MLVVTQTLLRQLFRFEPPDHWFRLQSVGRRPIGSEAGYLHHGKKYLTIGNRKYKSSDLKKIYFGEKRDANS